MTYYKICDSIKQKGCSQANIVSDILNCLSSLYKSILTLKATIDESESSVPANREISIFIFMSWCPNYTHHPSALPLSLSLCITAHRCAVILTEGCLVSFYKHLCGRLKLCVHACVCSVVCSWGKGKHPHQLYSPVS